MLGVLFGHAAGTKKKGTPLSQKLARAIVTFRSMMAKPRRRTKHLGDDPEGSAPWFPESESWLYSSDAPMSASMPPPSSGPLSIPTGTLSPSPRPLSVSANMSLPSPAEVAAAPMVAEQKATSWVQDALIPDLQELLSPVEDISINKPFDGAIQIASAVTGIPAFKGRPVDLEKALNTMGVNYELHILVGDMVNAANKIMAEPPGARFPEVEALHSAVQAVHGILTDKSVPKPEGMKGLLGGLGALDDLGRKARTKAAPATDTAASDGSFSLEDFLKQLLGGGKKKPKAKAAAQGGTNRMQIQALWPEFAHLKAMCESGRYGYADVDAARMQSLAMQLNQLGIPTSYTTANCQWASSTAAGTGANQQYKAWADGALKQLLDKYGQIARACASGQYEATDIWTMKSQMQQTQQQADDIIRKGFDQYGVTLMSPIWPVAICNAKFHPAADLVLKMGGGPTGPAGAGGGTGTAWTGVDVPTSVDPFGSVPA